MVPSVSFKTRQGLSPGRGPSGGLRASKKQVLRLRTSFADSASRRGLAVHQAVGESGGQREGQKTQVLEGFPAGSLCSRCDLWAHFSCSAVGGGVLPYLVQTILIA